MNVSRQGPLAPFLSYLTVIYVAWRVAWANRMPLMDCDEVYNYWEPLHFLNYGTGMQTWEYSPDYALRTYAYLLPMRALSGLYGWLLSDDTIVLPLLSSSLSIPIVSHNPKLLVFALLRATLAGTCAMAELGFIRALHHTTVTCDSVTMALILLFSTSTGMMHSSAAYLPSSSIMILYMLCADAYLRSNVWRFVILAIIATLAIGWPFGVLVYVPMGLHIVWLCIMNISVPWWKLGAGIVLTAVVVQTNVMFVDHYYYDHTWLSPTLNIFLYNAKSGGDELYGVEPLSYYVKNVALNLNYVGILGVLLGLPVAFVMRACISRPFPTHYVVCILAPVYVWLSVVVPRPHKEERFLYPIYPAVIVSATFTTHALWEMIVGRTTATLIRGSDATAMVSNDEGATATTADDEVYDPPSQKQSLVTVLRRYGWILLLVPSCGISLLRSAALSRYYAAPLYVYGHLPTAASASSVKLVCTCGEWYRFPSSFALPFYYELAFLPSTFKGQLPKPFGRPGAFNDQNREEVDRYVHVDDCDYVVQLESELDCAPGKDGTMWELRAEYPFLDAARTATLHRTLYLPYLHDRAIARGDSVQYDSYVLYQRTR